MKKLGLIGGVGPESTISYYHGIVYGVQEKMGVPFLPPLTIESLSAFEVIRMSSQGLREELADYLLTGIHNLTSAGADFGALACNTGHMVFEELQGRSPLPLVNIVDVTCAEAQRQGFTRLGLLGTAATMSGMFFKRPFERVGIEIVTPEAAEQELIALKITKELELGIVKQETAALFVEIVARMVAERNIQAVVLGCTELPLLFKDTALPIPVLDTMQIHIAALVKNIMEGETKA